MCGLLEEYQAVVPVEEDFHHPLAAVYHTSVLPRIETLIDADRMRPVYLFHEVKTRRVPIDELRAVDPELRTLANLNYPQDYVQALNSAGFDVPKELLGTMNTGPRRGQIEAARRRYQQ